MPSIYGSTGDGYAASALVSSWVLARNSAGNTADNNNLRDPSASFIYVEAGRGGTLYGIRRSFMFFDTSSISVAPSEATLKIRGFGYGTSNVIILRSTASDPISSSSFNDLYGVTDEFSNSDGAGAGSLSGISGLEYATRTTSWDNSDYNDLDLNSTALNDMASLDDFKICIMDWTYDFRDAAPSSTVQSGWYWTEAGSSPELRPYIDYTAGVSVTDNATFFGCNF